MPRWVNVCPADSLKPGQAKSVSVLARPYAVFNADGTLHGMEAACGHMKANLAAGRLYGSIVECAMHGWEYDVRTGECLTLPHAPLRKCAVKIEDGIIWIDIERPPIAASE